MCVTSVVALLLLAPHLSVQAADSWFNNIGDQLSSIWNDVSNATSKAGESIQDWSTNALRDVETSVPGEAVKDWSTNAWQDVSNATVDASTVVKDWSTNAWQDVSNATVDASTVVKDWSTNAWQDVSNATVDAATVVANTWDEIYIAFASITPECWGWMGGIAAATFSSIIFAMPWFLLALGFGALGPVALGLAAALQPSCGSSFVFGCLQSSAMTLPAGFFNCGRGQVKFAFSCWAFMIPLASLAAGGAAYAGYEYLPQCNETVKFTNVTDVH